MKNRILREISKRRTFLTFCAIGVLNTGINASLVVLLIERFGASQFIANMVAFFLSNVFSFFMNARLTFQTDVSVARYLRFLTSSTVVLGMTAVASAAADMLAIHYAYTLIFLIIVSPILNFVTVRYFAFRK